MADMLRIGRRTDDDDGPSLRDLARGRQHGRAAEAVADQYRRCTQGAAHVVGGSDQVGDVRREVGIGKVTLAVSQPGKVETHD